MLKTYHHYRLCFVIIGLLVFVLGSVFFNIAVGTATAVVMTWACLKLLRQYMLKHYGSLIINFTNTIGSASVMLEHGKKIVTNNDSFVESKSKAEDLFALMCRKLSISQRDIRNKLTEK